jgi:hypothetical protein
MEWTERDIAIAKQLNEPDTLAFLRKVLVEVHTQNGEVLAKNIVALDDAEYGRLMKVYHLTKEENKSKINLIKKIANTKVEAPNKRALAPK